jgi:hypothetical protein
MKQSLLYFIASALFFVAAALSTVNDGVTWKTFAGLTIGAGMIILGRNARKEGK